MKYVLVLLSLVVSLSSWSNESEKQYTESIDSITISSIASKAVGDSAYLNGDYITASQVYENLLNGGEAAELYYNLGNSYYKSGEMAKAILNYERALLLQPGNDDIRFNLEMAKAKTVDKVEASPEIFFVSWTKSLINMFSINTWACWAIAFFLLFIVSLYLFFFSKTSLLKKIGFFGGLVSIIFVVATNLFASQQKSRLTERETAIVMTPNVVVRSTPSESGTSLFVLHEGSKVKLNDTSMREWKEVKLEDGKVGWVPSFAIEQI